MRNNQIIVLNNPHLKLVVLNALFDNPDEIYGINCSTGSNSCVDFMDQEFPIDSDLVDPMYRLTLELLLTSVKLPIDHEADAKSE